MRLSAVQTTRATLLVGMMTALMCVLGAPQGAGPGLRAQDSAKPPANPEPAKPKVGLILNDSKATPGYTLISSQFSTKTYLIDNLGRIINTWMSDCNPGQAAYLLENGNLLRAGEAKNRSFFGGGAGGRLQEFTWDGKPVWDFTLSTETQLSHHDICRLPNGNVLMIVWKRKPAKEAVAAGRRPETVGDNQLMADSIVEVQPTGEKTGKIVWEWHAWDHLIQDFDAAKANHGDVGAHPELIDINFGEGTIAAMIAKPEELDKLRSIGYVGAAGRKAGRVQADWTHVNSVSYNAELDQVLLSVHEFSEIWVIDHSTKTSESASHQGGRSGKGGDLLYRWGNPRAYRAGTVKDQKLFGQHNAQWIPKKLPGEGHVLVFNNGMRRTGGSYSTVDEFETPVDAKGQYQYTPGKAFGPDKLVWSYVAPKRTDFSSGLISGAQRLANGNTFICSGINGTIFEVTPQNETVWKYVNPEKGSSPFGGPKGGGPKIGAKGGGPGGFGGPPRLGQILPAFLQDAMSLTADQKKQLEASEKQIAENLGKMLTDEQKKQFAEGGGFPQPGQLMPAPIQERLKLSDEQKKQLAEQQKAADEAIATILKDDQKKQLKEMQDRSRVFIGGPGGGPMGFPGGGPGGFGMPSGSSLFRAPRYAPDYAGLVGKDLTPGKTLEEIQPKEQPKQPPPPKDDPKQP